eukprot:5047142-Karenia_brevis.AAC.1
MSCLPIVDNAVAQEIARQVLLSHEGTSPKLHRIRLIGGVGWSKRIPSRKEEMSRTWKKSEQPEAEIDQRLLAMAS